MRTSAVICEFNPLHHGHSYILANMRERADCVIAIMSGNFVQRATPAVLDKYVRAQCAISAGADLVLELPFPWCCGSAEYFAKAGTAIAENALADELSFGIATDAPKNLFAAADAILSPSFACKLERQMQNGGISRGIASVREKCLKSILGDGFGDLLQAPNDILAIEYIAQIRKNGYKIVPLPVARLTEKDSPNFMSASRIREFLCAGALDDVCETVPEVTLNLIEEALNDQTLAREDVLAEIAFHILRTDLTPFLVEIADGGGGLFRRVYNAAQNAKNAAEMLALSATKKYTNARIRRVLLYYLTKITPEFLREAPRVTTVLAANEVGCAYLASIRKTTPLTILTKPSACRNLSPDLQAQYTLTLNVDRLYTLCVPCGREADYYLKQSPKIVR